MAGDLNSIVIQLHVLKKAWYILYLREVQWNETTITLILSNDNKIKQWINIYILLQYILSLLKHAGPISRNFTSQKLMLNIQTSWSSNVMHECLHVKALKK